jgi:hypothetical protein
MSFGIHSSRCCQTLACRSKMCPGSLIQQHQRDGTVLPASDPSRHPNWSDAYGSALRSAADRRAPKALTQDNGVELSEAPIGSRASRGMLIKLPATTP